MLGSFLEYSERLADGRESLLHVDVVRKIDCQLELQGYAIPMPTYAHAPNECTASYQAITIRDERTTSFSSRVIKLLPSPVASGAYARNPTRTAAKVSMRSALRDHQNPSRAAHQPK